MFDIERFLRGIAEHQLEEVENVYAVTFGSALFANDGMFVVFEMRDCAVVMGDAEALLAIHAALFQEAERRGRLVMARAWVPPRAWRRRLLGVVPALSVADGRYSKGQLERAKSAWHMEIGAGLGDL